MCLQSNFILAPVTSPLLSLLPISRKQKSLDIDKYFRITSSLENKTKQPKPSQPALYSQRSFHGEETIREHFHPLPGLGEEGMLCASSATCCGKN